MSMSKRKLRGTWDWFAAAFVLIVLIVGGALGLGMTWIYLTVRDTFGHTGTTVMMSTVIVVVLVAFILAFSWFPKKGSK